MKTKTQEFHFHDERIIIEAEISESSFTLMTETDRGTMQEDASIYKVVQIIEVQCMDTDEIIETTNYHTELVQSYLDDDYDSYYFEKDILDIRLNVYLDREIEKKQDIIDNLENDLMNKVLIKTNYDGYEFYFSKFRIIEMLKKDVEILKKGL